MDYVLKEFDGNKTLLYAWFSAMFTRVDVLMWSRNGGDELVIIAEKIKKELHRVELIANRFDEESEISRINTTAFKYPYKVSSELFQVLADCLTYHTSTLGYFDITVNSINGFTKGIAHIVLDHVTDTIRLLHPDVRIDLSGYIKGYVLRAVRNLLLQEEINNTLVNLGNSSVLALGSHPNGEGWKISLSELTVTKECVLHNQCLTTSGNKENTSWPIVQPLTHKVIACHQPVSVITDDPAIGEVLSTALYIASDEEKQLILNQLQGKIAFQD